MKPVSYKVAMIAAGFAMCTSLAQAQMHGGTASDSAPFGSPVDDQHVWMHAILDQFEGRFGKSNSLRWEGEAWAGTDTNRIWLKTEGQLTKGSEVEDGQLDLYYSRPISTYFDIQAGGRYDLDSGPGRGWGALGIQGLAPYFFHVSATAYLGDQGRFAAKLMGSYDLLVTQRLILQPELELNFYSKSDPARLVGSGLSELDLGLRLRYELHRKFAPYIGISYEKKIGQTADFIRATGEPADLLRFTFGVRAWL